MNQRPCDLCLNDLTLSHYYLKSIFPPTVLSWTVAQPVTQVFVASRTWGSAPWQKHDFPTRSSSHPLPPCFWPCRGHWLWWSYVHAKSFQSCLTLCDLMDYSPPGSSVHGILQARTLEWVAIPFSRGSPQPRDWIHVLPVSCIAGGFFTHWSHLGSPRTPCNNMQMLMIESKRQNI